MNPKKYDVTIYHTIGLEGCGHHGFSAIVDEVLKRTYKSRFKAKHEFQRYLRFCSDTGDYDKFEKCLVGLLNRNKRSIFHLDDSYPSGLTHRNLRDQKNIVKMNEIICKYATIRFIHLTRNIYDTINSHPELDNGLIAHAEKLCITRRQILDQLNELKKQNVIITTFEYETLNISGKHVLAVLLGVNIRLVESVINQFFKKSTKDYKLLLSPKMIDQITLVIQSYNA